MNNEAEAATHLFDRATLNHSPNSDGTPKRARRGAPRCHGIPDPPRDDRIDLLFLAAFTPGGRLLQGRWQNDLDHSRANVAVKKAQAPWVRPGSINVGIAQTLSKAVHLTSLTRIRW